jgi:hypothetical protein
VMHSIAVVDLRAPTDSSLRRRPTAGQPTLVEARPACFPGVGRGLPSFAA